MSIFRKVGNWLTEKSDHFIRGGAQGDYSDRRVGEDEQTFPEEENARPALDPFGRSEERKTERALIGEYRGHIEEVLAGLNAGNHALALEIASLPEQIRGYGHVKERNLAAARVRGEVLRQRWQAAPAPQRHQAA